MYLQSFIAISLYPYVVLEKPNLYTAPRIELLIHCCSSPNWVTLTNSIRLLINKGKDKGSSKLRGAGVSVITCSAFISTHIRRMDLFYFSTKIIYRSITNSIIVTLLIVSKLNERHCSPLKKQLLSNCTYLGT